MRGAVPCLSADLTTHAIPLQTLQDLKMGGSVRVPIVAQERCGVRELEGFHRGAGAPSVKVSIVAQERHEGREGWEREG